MKYQLISIFFQTTNPFRLLRNDTKAYKLKITDAILKVCHISLDPTMIVAHNQALKMSSALYPFWRSDIKSFMTDNRYHGKIPSKLWGHGGRVVTLLPPTSELGVRFPAWPQVRKLVVACCWSAVYSKHP